MVALLLLSTGCGIGSHGPDGGHVTFPVAGEPDAGPAVVGASDPKREGQKARLQRWLREHEQLLVGKP
jgi:hypothetical protein